MKLLMFDTLPFVIARRYIRGKRNNGFASFISWLSFLAMALGVMALIVVMSVMNGFNREIRDRILRVIPHAEIRLEQSANSVVTQLQDLEQVVGIAPFVSGYGMLSYQGLNKGVLVQGIDPESEKLITSVHQQMVLGDWEDIQPGMFGIVLGETLARSLGVVRGDSILLSLPTLNVTPAGVFPRFKRFQVLGVFRVGAQVDDGLAFIHFQDAQKIYRKGDKVDGYRLKLRDPMQVDALDLVLQDRLSAPYEYQPWSQKMASLFDAIKMEKMVVGAMLSSIIAVAAFNIIAGLVLMVADKRKDIAVLRTLGADHGFVQRLVLGQGVTFGVAGVMVGTLLGCLFATFIGEFVTLLEKAMGVYVFDPGVYFISQLPSELQWQDVLLISLLALALSVIASLYPAWRAGQIPPAEALRYDH